MFYFFICVDAGTMNLIHRFVFYLFLLMLEYSLESDSKFSILSWIVMISHACFLDRASPIWLYNAVTDKMLQTNQAKL